MLRNEKIKLEIVDFQKYIKTYRWHILVFHLLLMLIWLPWMTQTNLRIDLETLINTPYSTAGWVQIGRQGALFTKWLFGMGWFNPLLSNLAGYFLICLSSILYGYLFWRASLKKNAIYVAFGLIIFSAPIMAEQFYFSMLIFEVAWAYILCVLAIALSYFAILNRNVISGVIAIIAMIWTFCTYQCFVVLYVVGVVTLFVMLYERWTIQEQYKGIQYAKLIVGLMGLFFTAFAINSAITNVFFTSDDYLSSQILWKSLPANQCIHNVLEHIKQGFLGEGTFYTSFYGILALLTVAVVLNRVSVNRAKSGWLTTLAVVVLQCAPFLLTVYMGNIPVLRAQLSYPMVMACNIMILTNYLPQNKLMKIAMASLVAMLCWSQVSITERLIYTDAIRSQEDYRLASALEQHIGLVSDVEKPVAIIGTYDNQLNAACIQGETIGHSIFNWDLHVEPRYVSRTLRACNILKIYGFSFEAANERQVFEARKLALDMPSWPHEGSVVDAGEYIVVKLSEDTWPEELKEPILTKYSEVELSPQIVSETDIQTAVGSVTVDNGFINVQGWVFKENTDSKSVSLGVFLYDYQENSFYQMTTFKKRRQDVAEAFNSELYLFSGINAFAPCDGLEKSISEYDLYVGVRQDEQWYLRAAYYDLTTVQ